ncbi:MAG: male sterility protein-domain-containing protein [Monoraphidium minutum]|nr:MAG: male sterility protein-domain-containing protein [Monoraphidium minutum]
MEGQAGTGADYDTDTSDKLPLRKRVAQWLKLVPWFVFLTVGGYATGVVFWLVGTARARDLTVQLADALGVDDAASSWIYSTTTVVLIAITISASVIFGMALLLAIIRTVERGLLFGACCSGSDDAPPEPWVFRGYQIVAAVLNALVWLLLVACVGILAATLIWWGGLAALARSIDAGVSAAEVVFAPTGLTLSAASELTARVVASLGDTSIAALVSGGAGLPFTPVCAPVCLNGGSFAPLLRMRESCVCGGAAIAVARAAGAEGARAAAAALAGAAAMFLAACLLLVILTSHHVTAGFDRRSAAFLKEQREEEYGYGFSANPKDCVDAGSAAEDGRGSDGGAAADQQGRQRAMELPPYSIRGHFDGSTAVLLTGATGYIGSLVLEKLLRATAAPHVYVLLRPRRGKTPGERLAALLRGPLFHLLRPAGGAAGDIAPLDAPADGGGGGGALPLDPRVLLRVTAVAGDIAQPGLGLSDCDRALLMARVDTVIHCAADIRLEPHIHETLRSNYLGSIAAAQLAAAMPRLRSFVYVSTCYVNINRPRGSLVEEKLYPLVAGGQELDAQGLAEELLALPPDEAEARAQGLISYLGFRNTYALGKHLAEKAVAALQREHRLPLAILRPSLVSSVAYEPYAGFTGNYAGHVGACMAYLVGLYNDQAASVAVAEVGSVWHVVPADLVAHACLALAAAAAAAARAPRAPAAGAPGPAAPPLLIVQAATSTTFPLRTDVMFNHGFAWCSAHPRPLSLALRRASPMRAGQAFDAAAWAANNFWTWVKVEAASWLCRRLGQARGVRLLQAGWKTFTTINTLKYDLHLRFDATGLQRLEDGLAASERRSYLLVWRPPAAGGAAGRPGAVATGGAGGGPPRALSSSSLLSSASAGEPRAAGAGLRRRGGGAAGGSGASSPLSCSTPQSPPGSPRGAGKAAPAAEGGDGGRGGAASAAAAAAALDELVLAEGAACGAAGAAGGRPGVLPISSAGMSWQEFQGNTLAYLYSKLFQKEVPFAAPLPPGPMRALAAAAGEGARAWAGVMRHSFVAVKDA